MAAEVDVDATAAVEKRPSEKELFRAAETGDDSAFASLTPADLSLRNEDGRSLIHVAAAAGHPQVVLALMKAGGDDAVAGVLNAKDLDGLAPIHSVASTGDAQMMDILLKRGAKVNLISDRGRTALHYAATARSGKIDIAEKLKAHHADVKIQDKGLHQEKEKLRHLFVPEDEERNHLILKDLLVGQETTKIWTIPGSEWKMTHDVSETRLVKLVEKESSSVILSTEVARGASQKLVQLVWTLNSYGWSFLGDLSAEHILMTPTGDVRLKMIVWIELIPTSVANMKLNCKSIGSIIRECIFTGKQTGELPIEMDEFLKLLEDVAPENFGALTAHPALQEEIDMLAQFGQIYMDFLQIKKTNRGMYNKIVSKLPYRVKDEGHWMLRAMEIGYFASVLQYGSAKPGLRKRKVDELENTCSEFTVQEIAGYLPAMRERDETKEGHQGDLVRVARALNREKHLADLMDSDLLEIVLEEIAEIEAKKQAEEQPQVAKTKAEEAKINAENQIDRFILFRFIIDDLMVKYACEGGSFITDLRNCWQHLIEGHSLKKIDEHRYKIVFRYFQVAHILAGSYPGTFSKFYMAAYEQGLVKLSAEATFAEALSTAEQAMIKRKGRCTQATS